MRATGWRRFSPNTRVLMNPRGKVVIAALMPHAPVLLPEVAGGRVQAVAASIAAMSEAARRIVRARPQALVLVSPHAPRRGAAYTLRAGPRMQGSLESFGVPHLGVDLPSATSLADAIASAANARGVVIEWLRDGPLDHGAVVPLWHLARAGWHGPTVVVGLNDSRTADQAEMGKAIAEAAHRSGRILAMVASGDMSHRLLPGAPSGFHPRAVEFDRALIDCLESGDFRRLQGLDPVLQDLAAEDAVDSAVVAASAGGWGAHGHEVLSYQGPFGVGYGVAILYHDLDERRGGAGEEPQAQGSMVPEPWAEEDGESGSELPGIARRSLEAVFRGEDGMPAYEVTGLVAEPHPVFVTLRDVDGELRGCVGDLRPRLANTALEVWQLARDAAFRDHRFPAVTARELNRLRFEVSVVSPLEEVESEADLDAHFYGVVVEADDGRRGALLPDIEGVDTVEQQLAIVRRKGGIGVSEPVRLWRFTVKKFLEAEPPRGSRL